jgi:hypothetical protein
MSKFEIGSMNYKERLEAAATEYAEAHHIQGLGLYGNIVYDFLAGAQWSERHGEARALLDRAMKEVGSHSSLDPLWEDYERFKAGLEGKRNDEILNMNKQGEENGNR